MEKRLDAAIFDMDGLLLDSERPAVDAWVRAAEELGLNVSEAVVISTLGRDWGTTQNIVLDAFGGDAEAFDALAERSQRNYYQMFADGLVPLKPGAAEILRMMRDVGLPAGLATSTERKNAERKMSSAGLLGYISGSACGNEVSRGKPAPDIYLLAAKNIGVAPECCAALEDSPAGIRAAKAAGMTTIMVPDLVQPDEETLQYADYVLKDLYEAGKLLLRLFGVHSC